jgi:hypothetical protein
MSMQASFTGHPDPEQLMAFGEGEAPADVVTHVAACSTCAASAADYARAEDELRHRLYRFDCPDAHTLGEYHLDLLEPARRSSIAAHAAECEACSSELRTLRAYLAVPAPEMPESLMGRARRVIATLFAPSPDLASGGLRGSASAADTRLFEVDDATVTVGRGHVPGTLLGLVVLSGAPADALAGCPVRLLPMGGPPRSAALDEVGNFEFANLPRGMYALELDLPDAVVVIEELRVD